MILKALEVLRTELGGTDVAIIEDIAKGDTDATAMDGKIVITLLNVVEEPAMKNTSRLEPIKKPDERYKRSSPATYLNLYVMLTANKPTSYEGALVSISEVIQHFQAKNVLTSPFSPAIGSIPAVPEFDFTIHLNSLPLEQLSYAWGLLGGKIMPSVLYKLSIIKIQKFELPVQIGYIGNIDVDTHNEAKKKGMNPAAQENT